MILICRQCGRSYESTRAREYESTRAREYDGGVSTLAALMVLTLLSMMGLLVVYLVAEGSTAGANHFLSSQNFYVAQAGLEYGIKKIWEGSSPVVSAPGVSFGRGNFTTTWVNRTLTVTANVGNAIQRVHSVTSPSQADCTSLNVSNTEVENNDVKEIKLRKICLPQTVLDKMTVSWVSNGGEKIKKVKLGGSTLYNDGTGVASGTLLELADTTFSNGNTNNMTLTFNQDMDGKTVTISFQFGDSSTESVTFNPD